MPGPGHYRFAGQPAHRKTSSSWFGRLLSGFRLDLGFQRGDRGGVRFAPGEDVVGVGDAPGFLDVQQAQLSRG